MSEEQYRRWVADGSPWRVARPIGDLVGLLRRYGYTVYTLGNREHLLHEPPEDHTPYSATGYPARARYGVVYACDIMPPPAGSGLPSLARLGAQLVADRRAGVAGVRWLKYINWEPEGNYTGPCYHDSWQPTFARRASSDRGHIHLSGLTGYEDTDTGEYDPVARIRGEEHVDAATMDAIADKSAVALLTRPMGSAGLGVPPRPIGDWLKDAYATQLAVRGLAAKVDELGAKVGAPAPVVVDVSDPAVLDAIAARVADLIAARLAQ